jgi:hypothetical protein
MALAGPEGAPFDPEKAENFEDVRPKFTQCAKVRPNQFELDGKAIRGQGYAGAILGK